MSSYPPGWHPAGFEHRLYESVPTSIDKDSRTVDAILSTGSEVQRFYGREILAIGRDAVDIDRVLLGQCPVIDSHQTSGIRDVLGVVEDVWFRDGNLWGRLRFGMSPQGDQAWEMVRRKEISAVSIGYRVLTWTVRDNDGEIIDQEQAYPDASTFSYTADRWQLLEVSICSVGSDIGAGIRSMPNDSDANNYYSATNTRARMRALQAATDRQSRLLEAQMLFEDDDDNDGDNEQ